METLQNIAFGVKDQDEQKKWAYDGKTRMFMGSPSNGKLRWLAAFIIVPRPTSTGHDFMIYKVKGEEVVVKDKLDYKKVMSQEKWRFEIGREEGYASKENCRSAFHKAQYRTAGDTVRNILEKSKVKKTLPRLQR